MHLRKISLLLMRRDRESVTAVGMYNLFKPKERAISEKEMQQRSKRIYNTLPEVTKKKEEEEKRMISESNRMRVEIFKKKLLDQIHHRNVE
ncbi:hypothetical protein FKM82_019090 [Ascaphus truei]